MYLTTVSEKFIWKQFIGKLIESMKLMDKAECKAEMCWNVSLLYVNEINVGKWKWIIYRLGNQIQNQYLMHVILDLTTIIKQQ